MYNKLFTKILHSSIWAENYSTRLVWVTLLAAMDEHGLADFSGIPALSRIAAVTLEEAREAVRILESPDPDSGDPENEGRRIERVPGGWMVLNEPKYRAIATRLHQQEQTKLRVRKFREGKQTGTVEHVTLGNADVTHGNDSVTPSETEPEPEPEPETEKKGKSSPSLLSNDDSFDASERESGGHFVLTNGSKPSFPPKTYPRAQIIGPNKARREDDVREVFAYYCKAFGRTDRYKLTDLRMKLGLARLVDLLNEYSDIEEAKSKMKRAIDGIRLSPHHMGENKDGTLYIDWENHIFDTYERMEKWMNYEPQERRNGNGNKSLTSIAAVNAVVADLESRNRAR
jgi:hypothetical protein